MKKFIKKVWPEVKDWGWEVLVAFDQLLNALCAPVLNFILRPLPQHRFGYRDETISSVMGKNVREGHCRGCYWICRVLHILDPDHCKKSIEDDERWPLG